MSDSPAALSTPGAGRFAPSPSGDLHVGNLRTAILAWLFARASGRRFLLRVEDLDPERSTAEAAQLRDLTAVGLSWDAVPVHQSERTGLYLAAIDRLAAAGLVYECFCTRSEIADAPRAPHAPPGAYPGTCRGLSDADRARRRRERPAALRLRAGVEQYTVTDLLHGEFTGPVDDLVLLRMTGCRRTTSPWWSMTPRRASTRWSAAATYSPPRRGRPIWRRCSTCRRWSTRMCRWS